MTRKQQANAKHYWAMCERVWRARSDAKLIDPDFDDGELDLTDGERKLYTTNWYAVTGCKGKTLNHH
jgi:hypothetical protein